jgi:isopenicillin-N epimerase
LKRRDFLGAAGAVLAWPADLRALGDLMASASGAELWDLVRAAFTIPGDRIYLNVATLGVQPRVVVDAVIEHTRRVATSYPPAMDWDRLKARAAALLHADPAGFVFPRNTTEAMNFVANGLDLRPGDEVITTLHEHIGGLCCWELLAARRGITLRQVPLPAPAASADELLRAVCDVVSERTRVISVSHVLFTNGTVMPVAAIAAFCRERGIICVVDGAHPPGMMHVDIGAIAPDFYASSPHKWLCAPQGTGLLWLAEPWRTRLWPTIASGGWNDSALGAHRLNHLGTLDESRLAGLDAALQFHETIGPQRIFERVRTLRRHLLQGLAATPGVRITSPSADELGAGMVSFTIDGLPAHELQRFLAAGANVRSRVVSEYDYGWLRLSPHVYNTFGELDRVLELIRRAGVEGRR